MNLFNCGLVLVRQLLAMENIIEPLGYHRVENRLSIMHSPLGAQKGDRIVMCVRYKPVLSLPERHLVLLFLAVLALKVAVPIPEDSTPQVPVHRVQESLHDLPCGTLCNLPVLHHNSLECLLLLSRFAFKNLNCSLEVPSSKDTLQAHLRLRVAPRLKCKLKNQLCCMLLCLDRSFFVNHLLLGQRIFVVVKLRVKALGGS
mmetsp:Transcript_74420/g.170698  ORF Transcript_74420/g.170698 Transcript_74420/m.170698 type:complete len:201 (-) Transcript_74420:808-1410(-)